MLQTVKLSCLADRKEALIVAFLLQGGPPQLVFLWPVVITGAMSIYNSLYCRLLKRMTNCWLTLLMGILHLHRYRTKQLNQVLWLRPISACFYMHIITETKPTSCECMCVRGWAFSGVTSSVLSLSKLHLKKKKWGYFFRVLSIVPVHPTVQKQPKYFVSAPRLQLLLLLAPQALLYLWPPWPVPTIAPVGMAIHSSVLRIEKPDSLTRRFN